MVKLTVRASGRNKVRRCKEELSNGRLSPLDDAHSLRESQILNKCHTSTWQSPPSKLWWHLRYFKEETTKLRTHWTWFTGSYPYEEPNNLNFNSKCSFENCCEEDKPTEEVTQVHRPFWLCRAKLDSIDKSSINWKENWMGIAAINPYTNPSKF